MFRYLAMLLCGAFVFVVCTVITPYWGVVAVFVYIFQVSYNWHKPPMRRRFQ